MTCSKCGNQRLPSERFCRKCGADLDNVLVAPVTQSLLKKRVADDRIAGPSYKDPDELTGNGIGSVIVGDGFLMVALFLSAAPSSIGTVLWLLLLIPAFFFFGKGFADVFHARQIRLRLKQSEVPPAPTINDQAPPASVVDVFKNYRSGRLVTAPSVTERTTRELE